MGCSIEALQAFLDGELEPVQKDAVRRHLARCPACRQELSRLRLLWFDLEQDEVIEVPLELPFIRQQAIALTRAARQETEGTSGGSLWEAQKLAWQPALAGVAQIPGPRQIMRLARAAGNGVPTVLRGVASVWGKMTGRRRGGF